MNQVANLKSLKFTWKKQQIYWESPQAFNLNISAIVHFVVDDGAKLVFLLVIVEADDSTAPTL